MKEIIVSEDIKLKPLEETSSQAIFQVIDNERDYLGKWLPFVAFTHAVNDTLEFIRTNKNTPELTRELIWEIYFQENFVGLIGLKFAGEDKNNKRTEIGYWLSEKDQKKGIVTQSVKKLMDYAFTELNLNRVQIRCATGNIPSKSIPKRLGFTFEGVEREGELSPDGRFTDLEVYSFLRNDWE